jgi:hypothetical protein
MRGRPLTYDERKAAEAAFSRRPLNPNWSAAARFVYYGVVDAMSARHADRAGQSVSETEATSAATI